MKRVLAFGRLTHSLIDMPARQAGQLGRQENTLLAGFFSFVIRLKACHDATVCGKLSCAYRNYHCLLIAARFALRIRMCHTKRARKDRVVYVKEAIVFFAITNC